LKANLANLPPIRVHVGDDEMLLDDAERYVERAVAAWVNATLNVWDGMPHGFLGGAGQLSATGKARRDRCVHRPALAGRRKPDLGEHISVAADLSALVAILSRPVPRAG